MSVLDWSVVGATVAGVWLIGFFLARRSSGSTEQFFASGRGLPWWLLGTSMAASAFSSDTPHYVATLVRNHGIARNWEWWGAGIGGVLVAFLLAPLWRRVGVLTDLELIEVRYGGRGAAALRGFRAIHTGLFLNALTMAGPLAGMLLVLDALGMPASAFPFQIGAILLCATLLYSFCGGFWGVIVTDFLQFLLAMGAAIVVAWLAVDRAGGLSAILAAAKTPTTLFDTRVPKGDAFGDGLLPLLVFAGVQWWTYINADGGGKIVQRMVSAKSEAHAVWGTLWFNLTHYAIRTWPWVLVGLASFVIVPHADPKMAYAATAVKVLPSGLLGLFVASFVAAFMSTVDTQLNWGASYLVHDFYRRFLVRKRSEAHYVSAARLATLLLAAAAVAGLAFAGSNVTAYLRLAVQASLGYGVALLARWFWWRANAAGEIAALSTAFVATFSLRLFLPALWPGWQVPPYAELLLLTAVPTIAVWLLVVWLSPAPEPRSLLAFFRKARPPGFWGPVAALAPEIERPPLQGFLPAGGGLLLVFGATLGLGWAFLLRPLPAAAAFVAAACGAGILIRESRRKAIACPEGGADAAEIALH